MAAAAAAVAMESSEVVMPSLRVDASSNDYRANQRMFREFLDNDSRTFNYRGKVQSLIEKKAERLSVDLNDLRLFNPDLTASLLQRPISFIPPFEDALNLVANHIRTEEDPAAKIHQLRPLRIGFEGSFGQHRTTPRLLSSHMLGKLVCVEGIVTRCSLVKPKVVSSVHYCAATQSFSQQNYTDATSFTNAVKSSPFYPRKDDDGNPLTTEFGLCTYKDHQTVSIQEMPERAPPGLLPCSVDVILDEDLVDSCKPGDRVQIVGVYRAIAPNAASGRTMFRTLLIGNNVQFIGKEASAAKPITKNDVAAILGIARRPDVFELLGRSLAPSIYGHEQIKKALMLAMIGGAEKILANGTHLRGDINILMVGDPSTAKSQLLRSVLNHAPLALSTTGRGSSGVGLTAAVTQDKETGERRLEAGAMVLADRGMVCIDEFDKMSDGDRVAIHEVMEQQTVTIAKAGIHTSLNARCSVIAAANPVYGQYDDSKPPHVNIGLPDSLLSRFDLLFIVLDQMDPEIDRHIASHVLNLHQFVQETRRNAFSGPSLDDDVEEMEESDDTTVFEKFDPMLHGAAGGEVLSASFVKKFVQFVRSSQRMPKLSNEAVEFIGEAYTSLRLAEDRHTLPVTARLLETLIRLSTAHARIRMSKAVQQADCQQALNILNFAMSTEAAAAVVASDEDDDEAVSEDIANDDAGVSSAVRAIAGLRTNPTRRRRRRRQRTARLSSDEESSSEEEGAEFDDEMEDGDSEDEPFSETKQRAKKSKTLPGKSSASTSSRQTRSQRSAAGSSASSPHDSQSLSQSGFDVGRFNMFQRLLVQFMKKERLDPCPIDRALEGVNSDQVGEKFTREEVEDYLLRLEQQERVFYREGSIYFT